MLTTSLSELKAADISKPILSDVQEPYPASRTMTILLGKNGMAGYYMGEMDNAIINTSSLRKIENRILENKLSVSKLHNGDPAKHLVVIIKPTKMQPIRIL